MQQIFNILLLQPDFTPITGFFQQNPDKMLMQFFFTVGWIPIAFVFVWGVVQLWVYYCQAQYTMTLKYNLLAIDIPKGNTLSPKAVENIFTYFGGAHSTFNLIEKYWLGLYQLAFSFEIVSIEGYTQFLLWTPVEYRNMAETAIYSQYPDAEITEVNDYTTSIPTKYPDEEYNVWGCEYVPTNHWAFPIKTWKSFEHPSGEPEEQFRDPMATLMDLCSSLGKGEQLWHQIIVYPTGFDWPEEGEKQISKIIGEKVAKKKDFADGIIDFMMGILTGLGGLIFSFGEAGEKKSAEEDNRFLMMNLKPKQKKQIEAIQEKTSQLGFGCKIRFVYVAKKEVMNKLKVRNGFIGYMKQFMDLDSNNLRPEMDMTATSADYFFEEYIKNDKRTRLVAGYKSRSGTKGKKRFILNIEELATIWHFPIEAVVKAPLIQKAPGRKSEPPMSLPMLTEQEIDSRLFDDKSVKTEDIFSDSYRESHDKNNVPIDVPVNDSLLFDISEKPANEAETAKPDDFAPSGNVTRKGMPPSNLPFA